MKQLVIVLAIMFAASLVPACAQVLELPEPAKKTVLLSHKKNLSDLSISFSSNFDVKIIDVTDRLPATVKVHPGDEVAVVRDPRVDYCCGDLSQSIQSVYVRLHNPDAVVPPVLVYSPDVGGPIVRAFIANGKGTATLEIVVTCRDSSGRQTVKTKTVKVVVR